MNTPNTSAANVEPRKKSPRAPSLTLKEAVDMALKIYDKERRHAAPVDAVSQHMGYKSANTGSALSALASLKYYGLVDRNQPGKISVSKDVESYSYSPTQEVRDELLIRWLKSPPVFAELLDQYQEGLPSDATIKYFLIQKGFFPSAADSVVSVFRDSVEFAQYFKKIKSQQDLSDEREVEPAINAEASERNAETEGENTEKRPTSALAIDRIPVRLPGGRRAWLEIPTPFYQADKDRLKNQIDLLLTIEDESIE